MNYFYDIKVNFDDEQLYEFYEWQKKDNIESIKKIPLNLVSSNTMKDLLKHTVVVEKNFLEKIINKTENFDGKKIKYASIFADSKTSLVVEFNDEGKSVFKSKLLLNDDLNIVEIVHNLNRTTLQYSIKKEKNILRNTLRQETEIKKVLNLEIDTLYEKKDLLKLKYLYYEWLNEKNNDIDEIYKILKEKLKEDLTKRTFEIYEIIKLSYKTR